VTEWFCGTVLGRVPGNGVWYNVKYDGEQETFTLNLQEDIDRGNVHVIVS